MLFGENWNNCDIDLKIRSIITVVALPGGWCDVDQSVASNTEKGSARGCRNCCQGRKVIAVQDWRRHNRVNSLYGVIKIFLLCEYEQGSFKENIETTESGFFDIDGLPFELVVGKTTREQILMCFDFYKHTDHPIAFD